MSKRTCAGTNADGTPCKRPPLRDGDRCHWHAREASPKNQRKRWFDRAPFTPEEKALWSHPSTALILEGHPRLGLYLSAVIQGKEAFVGLPAEGRGPLTPENAIARMENWTYWQPIFGERLTHSLADPAFRNPVGLLITAFGRGQAVYARGAERQQQLREFLAHVTVELLDGSKVPGAELIPLVRWDEAPPVEEGFAPALSYEDQIETVPASKEPVTPPAALITDVPPELPLVTSEEPRVLLEGISRRDGWEPAAEGALRVWRPRPNGHEVRLSVYNPPEEWGPAELSRKLDAIVSEMGLNTAFLAAVTVSTLAEGTRQHSAAVASGAAAPVADLAVDELLQGMGRWPDGRAERNELRRWARKRLLELSGALVVGARRGKYREKGSRQETDTYQDEALFLVIDPETTWEGSQPSFDGSGVPLRLRIHGGGLFTRIARNPAMLQYLGNLRCLAEIPGGKAGGQWGRAIGFAFAELIREQAGKPRPRQTFTRRELLLRLLPDPSPEAVLAGDHPERALTYWKVAKQYLIDAGWWLPFEEPGKPATRFGWGEAWLDQEVTPPPGPKLAAPLPELAARGEAARKRPGRPRKKPEKALI